MRLRGLVTLKKRGEFLAARFDGRSASSGGLLLQAVGDPQACDGVTRVGFTVSKKSGNAVIRNKIKRRLRVLAQDVISRNARRGFCYVLVSSGRLAGVSFVEMRLSLISCLKRLDLYSLCSWIAYVMW